MGRSLPQAVGNLFSSVHAQNFMCLDAHLGFAVVKTEDQLQSQQCFPIVIFPEEWERNNAAEWAILLILLIVSLLS